MVALLRSGFPPGSDRPLVRVVVRGCYAKLLRHHGCRRRDWRRTVADALDAVAGAAQAEPGAAVAAGEVAAQIRAAVGQLPERQREVVEWHVWHGQTFAEIAARRGGTRESAHGMYRRALDYLRRVLSDDLAD